MLGAIIGDVVGSRFEFNNIKTKKFDLFDKKCKVTDDSVMSVAVAEMCLNGYVPDNTPRIIQNLKNGGSAILMQVTAIGSSIGCSLMSTNLIILAATEAP